MMWAEERQSMWLVSVVHRIRHHLNFIMSIILSFIKLGMLEWWCTCIYLNTAVWYGQQSYFCGNAFISANVKICIMCWLSHGVRKRWRALFLLPQQLAASSVLLVLVMLSLDVFVCHCYVPTGCMQGLWGFVCYGSWVLKH
jgi:hypothetical protein